MTKKIFPLLLFMLSLNTFAQEVMTPELLFKLGRVSAMGITIDQKSIVYKVTTVSVDENKSSSKIYSIPLNGGNATEIKDYKSLISDKNVSKDGKLLYDAEAKIENVLGKISTQNYQNRMFKFTRVWITDIGTLGMKASTITFFTKKMLLQKKELTF